MSGIYSDQLSTKGRSSILPRFASDSAFILDKGSVEELDMYINSLTKKIRIYTNGSWSNLVTDLDTGNIKFAHGKSTALPLNTGTFIVDLTAGTTASGTYYGDSDFHEAHAIWNNQGWAAGDGDSHGFSYTYHNARLDGLSINVAGLDSSNYEIILSLNGLSPVTIDVTGNLGATPGSYTIATVISAINLALSAAYGGSYSAVATNYGGIIRLQTPGNTTSARIDLQDGAVNSALNEVFGFTENSGTITRISNLLICGWSFAGETYSSNSGAWLAVGR